MKMQVRWIAIAAALLLCLTLFGCDNGLRYVKIEVATAPEQTVYYVGEDDALRFDGGTVLLTCADGSTELVDMQTYTYQREGEDTAGERYLSSDVDFSRPGIYHVTVRQTRELSCRFEIEVNDPG